MCGLAGVIGDLSQGHKDAFRDLLDVAQVRGRHSTGVIAVTQQNAYRYAKEVGPPAFLYDTRRYGEATNGLLSALIGHCRHKTVGDISRATAHPFDFPEKGIIGVHNGTLRNYYRLPEHHHSKVDSEILFEHLANNGAEATFSNLEGAFACVWWDNNTNTINFIRNKERPLWFAWSKDLKAMFWASELWMLHAAERKYDFNEGDDKENPKKYIQLPLDTLWSFKVHPNDKDRKIEFLGATKIEPKEVQSGQGNAHGGTNGQYTGNRPAVPPPGWRYDPQLKCNVRITPVSQGQVQGGKVVDPFQQRLLDDPLPGETPASTADEKTSTSLSDVPFMHTSLTPTASTTPSSSSRGYRNNILSPRFPSSKGSGQQDKRNVTAPSAQSRGSMAFSRELLPVSTRKVAGMWYITDNLKKVEYEQAQFEQNTGAKCCHCNHPIGSLQEVATFIDSNRFVCTSCTKAPKIPRVPLVSFAKA